MAYVMNTRPSVKMQRRPRRRGMGDIWDDIETFIDTGGAVDPSEADPADNINQTANGTSTSAADFTVVNGVCKPQNFPALAASRNFQSQLNRVAQIKGFSKITTDGALGTATMTLFKQVQSAAPAGQIMGDSSSCMGVAPDVDVLGQQIQAFADSLGAPATVSGPALSLSTPSIVTKSGKTIVAPDAGIMGDLAKLSGVEKLALLGLAGGIGYMMLTKKKHKPTTTRRR
jgi:hypothetical protein